MSNNTTVRCIENNASNIFFIRFNQFYVNQYQNISGAKDKQTEIKMAHAEDVILFGWRMAKPEKKEC
jgi:hypothetical protein